MADRKPVYVPDHTQLCELHVPTAVQQVRSFLSVIDATARRRRFIAASRTVWNPCIVRAVDLTVAALQ